MLKQVKTASTIWALFLGCAVVSLALSSLTKDMNWQLPIVAVSFGLFAFVGWFVAIPMLQNAVKKQCEEGNALIAKLCSTFLTSEIVEHELQRLAKIFDTLCKLQIQLQGTEYAQDTVQDLSRRLEGAKSDFWTAHALSWQTGYPARKKLKNYLPEDPSTD